MKFLFFTDAHVRAQNPVSRKDNFRETILQKLKWVAEESCRQKAVLLCGGDLFHRPDTPISLVAEVGVILQSAYQSRCFLVLGNHDIYGYRQESFIRTPAYILEQLGILHRLGDAPITVSQGHETIAVTGADYCYAIDGVDKKAYFPKPIDSYDFHIHVIHGFLTDHVWPHVECTTLKQIEGTAADVILSGHEHSGYGVKQISKTICCNPGALGRISASVGDINQVVKVALIDTEEKSVTLLPLPETLARPAMEVIDRDALLAEKEQEKNAEMFFSSLSTLPEEALQSHDIHHAFSIYAKQENLSASVICEVEKRLSHAEWKKREMQKLYKEE